MKETLVYFTLGSSLEQLKEFIGEGETIWIVLRREVRLIAALSAGHELLPYILQLVRKSGTNVMVNQFVSVAKVE